jgi:DNA polymerase-3 subunit epsilon
MTPERPLIFYDVETTGLNSAVDRITQLAAIKLWPGDSVEEGLELLNRSVQQGGKFAEPDSLVSQTFNPGMLVEPYLLELTHLTQEELNASASFTAWAPWLYHFFNNSIKDGVDYGHVDLAGYNSNKFDINMIQAEFKRAKKPLDETGRNLLDAAAIFYKKQPRTLEAALKYYCNETTDNAHNALVDIQSTVKVFLGQQRMYEDMPEDNAGIAKFGKNDNWVDSTGKILWQGKEAIVGFGNKCNGKTLKEIVRTDAGYLQWMLGQDFPADTKQIIGDAVNGIFPIKEQQ